MSKIALAGVLADEPHSSVEVGPGVIASNEACGSHSWELMTAGYGESWIALDTGDGIPVDMVEHMDGKTFCTVTFDRENELSIRFPIQDEFVVEEFDPTDHVVLGSWPDSPGRYAVLFFPGIRMDPFVAAYGYDPETRTWSQGHYFRTASEAWNHADPDIVESLSEPVTFDWLTEDFEDIAGKRLTEEGLRDYADDCQKLILMEWTEASDIRVDEAREWAEFHDEETFFA